MDAFNGVLLRISNELRDDNLNSLKFLCSDLIGKKHLERVKSGTDLFQHLKQLNKIGPDDAEFLRNLLVRIQRHDLAEIIDDPEYQPSKSPEGEDAERLNLAINIIGGKLGMNWRKVARKLGLTDAQVEAIREKYPFTLEEQGRSALVEWKKLRSAEARVENLIQALRSCSLNYTADEVEKELRT
ncbi:FAS-associated death domain protein [Denticeps clupeoides]|uniref:FADD n=1 Tax=Denticeps clupeoides TaxID=299321 RepID=A0AAY4EIJ3_9TELE|nr:FAS-associated death domain protein [Denticeps clupeoides]